MKTKNTKPGVVKKTAPIKKNNVEQIDLTNIENPKPKAGLGDLIKTVTNALGIETCDKCEERRLKLNKFFPFLRNVKRNLTDEEVKAVLEMESTKNIPDSIYFLKVFNEVYGLKQKPCQCPSIYRDLLNKLVMQVKYQEIE